jgi:2-amino-4-hydroxy-6-hydroxymethyldihydropteridine diphosphokinase
MSKKLVYIALGSNLGDRAENLNRARKMLAPLTDSPIKESPVYECPSQGVEGLPDFYNQVIEFHTSWEAFDVMCYLKGAEIFLGRQNRKRWHSREIDLDLLFFDHSVIKEKYYTVPHKEISNRRFVLQPLADLNPTLSIPLLNTSVEDLLNELISSGETAQLRRVN